MLDTLEDLANSMNHTQKSGLPIHDRENINTLLVTECNLALRTLPPNKREESYVRHCHELVKETYGKMWADTTQPYTGIPELLIGLQH